MVLWTLFAVILLLCGSTDAKTDNDFQRISSSSIDLLQKGFQRFGGKTAACRYSKLLSALKENFNLDTETTNFDNKPWGGTNEINSLEEQMQDDMTPFEEDDRSEHLKDTYEDLNFLKNVDNKRGTNSPIKGCDCKIKNDLLDLGHLHYPRYLLNAVCQKDDETFEYPPKCWRGAQCKPLEYKVRVLTYRSHNDHLQKDPAMSLLPDVLRSIWKFKTVTVAAGCFCS